VVKESASLFQSGVLRTEFSLVVVHDSSDVVLEDGGERRLVVDGGNPRGELLGPDCAFATVSKGNRAAVLGHTEGVPADFLAVGHCPL
jgi:hypothetical protein